MGRTAPLARPKAFGTKPAPFTTPKAAHTRKSGKK